jgi:hypothetical protein
MVEYSESTYEFENQGEVLTFVDDLCKDPANNKVKIELHLYDTSVHKWCKVYADSKHRGIGILGLVKKMVEAGSLVEAVQASYPNHRFGNIGACKVIVLRKV